MNDIKEQILFAGHGGQGIISMGKFIAHTGMLEGYQVTWIPSYGAEVRGGTAHSMIRIQSKGVIANPMVSNPTICFVMNQPSLDRFFEKVQQGGLLMVDSSTVSRVPNTKKFTVIKAPFTKMAMEMQNKRVANVIAVGALNKIKGLFSKENLIECLSFMLKNKKELVDINVKALETGYSLNTNQ